jgi:transposase
MSKQRVTVAQKREIKNLFKQGIKRRAIATKLGINYATVCYWIPASRRVRVKRSATTQGSAINWKAKYLDAIKILAENGLV